MRKNKVYFKINMWLENFQWEKGIQNITNKIYSRGERLWHSKIFCLLTLKRPPRISNAKLRKSISIRWLSHRALGVNSAWKVEIYHTETVKGVGGWGKDPRSSTAHLLLWQHRVGSDQQFCFLGNFYLESESWAWGQGSRGARVYTLTLRTEFSFT